MRPCRCGGSNENCCFCYGSGYVKDDPAHQPQPPTDLRNWLPNRLEEREPTPRPYIRKPIRWKEIIVGILALCFPLILLLLHWLWRQMLDAFSK